MAAPVIESVGALTSGGPATTTVLALPSGLQEGDLMVALLVGAGGDTTQMSCTGWTHVLTAGGGGTAPKVGILYRIAGPSESSPTFTVSDVDLSTRRGRLLRVSGYDGTAVSGATPASGTGSGTDRTHPSITTAVDDCLQISLLWWASNDATYTQPSGFTNLFTDNRFAGDSIARPTAGATGTATGSGNSAVNIVGTWAIRPGSGASQTSPTVQQDTVNEAHFTTATPTLLFTGVDDEGDDIRYEIQISDHPDNLTASGVLVVDSLTTGSGGSFHPQPASTGLTWNEQIPVDDRMGQSYTTKGGSLKKITLPIGDRRTATDGDVLVRVYEHEGTFGTSSAPKDATVPGDGPTPDWLAESERVTILGNDPVGATEEFEFTGDDRIRITPGTKLVLISDWLPNDRVDQNTFAWSGAVLNNGDDHPGNLYNDGHAPQYHGAQATWDLHFSVYEEFVSYAADSAIDLGFANQDTPLNESPFINNEQIGYTVQTPLHDGTWFWRVRGRDPDGTDEWGAWSEIRSFTLTASQENLHISGWWLGNPPEGEAVTVQANLSDVADTVEIIAVTKLDCGGPGPNTDAQVGDTTNISMSLLSQSNRSKLMGAWAGKEGRVVTEGGGVEKVDSL